MSSASLSTVCACGALRETRTHAACWACARRRKTGVCGTCPGGIEGEMKTKCCSEVTDRRSASRTRADRVATESAPGHFHVEEVVEVLARRRCPFGSSARRPRYTSVRCPSTSRHPQGPSAPSSYVSVPDRSYGLASCVEGVWRSSVRSERLDGICRLWMRVALWHGVKADSSVCAQPEQVRQTFAVSSDVVRA